MLTSFITERGEKIGHINEFNDLANKYDTPETIKLSNITSNTIFEALDKGMKKKAIDFGGGTGLVGLQLINYFQSMLFLDASQEMIDQVNLKIEKLGIKNVNTLCTNLENEGQLSFQADTIFSSMAFHHIGNYNDLLTKMHDMLEEKGQLVLVDMEKQPQKNHGTTDGYDHGFDRHKLSSVMEK